MQWRRPLRVLAGWSRIAGNGIVVDNMAFMTAPLGVGLDAGLPAHQTPPSPPRSHDGTASVVWALSQVDEAAGEVLPMKPAEPPGRNGRFGAAAALPVRRRRRRRGRATLLRAGQPQTLEPKAFAVLLVLLRRAGELVGRDDCWTRSGAIATSPRRADPRHRPVAARARGRLPAPALHPDPARAGLPVYRRVGNRGRETAPESPPIGGWRLSVAGSRRGHARRLPTNRAASNYIRDGTARMSGPRPRSTGWQVGRREAERRDRRAAAVDWLVGGAVLAAIAAAGWWLIDRVARRAPVAPSIAVLPFTSCSATRADRYFAEGLAAEMHSALAGVPGLQVAAWMPPAARTDRRQEDVKTLGQAGRGDRARRERAPRRRCGCASAPGCRTRGSGFTLWSRTYERSPVGRVRHPERHRAGGSPSRWSG